MTKFLQNIKLPDKETLLELRNSKGMTFQEIADVYGASRQRVHQIIGGDGKTFRDNFVSRNLNISNSMTTAEAVNLLGGKMKSTIYKYIKRIHHRIDGNSNLSIGDQGERLVSSRLSEHGIGNSLLPLMSTYDIITDSGISIDVKTANTQSRTYEFQKTEMYKFAIRKKKKGEYCDVFALYVVPRDVIFIVPSCIFPMVDIVYINFPFSNRSKVDWGNYLENYNILIDWK